MKSAKRNDSSISIRPSVRRRWLLALAGLCSIGFHVSATTDGAAVFAFTQPAPVSNLEFHPMSMGTLGNLSPSSVNFPPRVVILSPVDGTVLAAPTGVIIDARASDPDGTIASLAWFSGTNLLGEIHFDIAEQTVEHELIFSYLPAGEYSFTAVAADNTGARGTSAPVRVTVQAGLQLPIVTVRASDPRGSEQGSDPVVFTVTRTPVSDQPLLVYYSQRSSIPPPPGEGVVWQFTIEIPGGAASAEIVVTPEDNALIEGPETIEVGVGQSWVFGNPLTYEIGEPSSAQAVIEDNDSFPGRRLLNIDFGGDGSKRGPAAIGLGTNDYWNGHSQPWIADQDQHQLRWSDASTSSVDLRVENAGGQWFNFTGDSMYDSYMYPNNGQGDGVGEITVRLTGVPPGRYDLYLYGKADPTGHSGSFVRGESDSIFSLAVGANPYYGAVGTHASAGWTVAQPWREGYEYVHFRAVPVEQGQPLEITVAPGYNQQPANGPERPAVLNGLQLIQAPPPQLPPVVTIVATDARASEEGADRAVFTVRRVPVSQRPLSVSYVVGGTASNGVDYARLTGTVEIAAGEASAQIVVRPIDDSLVEGTETVRIEIHQRVEVVPTLFPTTPSAYVVGEPGSAEAFILDNDSSPPRCGDSWPNHGAFVRAVIAYAWQAYRSGFITRDERRALISAAVRSDCGKRPSGAEPVQVHVLPLTPEECRREGFQILLSGATSAASIVETSLDLKQWQPLRTNLVSITGTEIICPMTDGTPTRFYRVRLIP